MLSRTVCNLFVGAAALLLLLGLFLVYVRGRKLTYGEFKARLRKFRILNAGVLILAILAGSVFAVFAHAESKNHSVAMLSLNYSEASTGQNANGTRYNMSEILCEEVLERAIRKGALPGVSAEDLRQALSVFPVVEGNASRKDKYHISTEFVITYDATEKTRHLDADNVSFLVASAYKEYYVENYVERFAVQPLTDNEALKDLEYMDCVAYIKTNARRTANYMWSLKDQDPSFTSDTGATFGSIANKMEQVISTQINGNLEGYLLQNGIVKNPASYRERLEFENRQIDYKRQEKLASYNIRNEAIGMYSEEMTRIVLVPTWDYQGKYYMGRTKVGLDDLSVEATKYSEDVAEYDRELQTNRRLLKKMTWGGHWGPDEKAEEMIREVCINVDRYSREAASIVKQYGAYRLNECIAISIYGNALAEVLKQTAVLTAAVYLGCIMILFGRNLPKKNRIEQ